MTNFICTGDSGTYSHLLFEGMFFSSFEARLPAALSAGTLN